MQPPSPLFCLSRLRSQPQPYQIVNDADENTGFELLLTRSKGLAQKLKVYTKRLIDTRRGIIDPDAQIGEDTATSWDDSEEDTTQNLLSLDEHDFPLVCTFNYFLRLLENLVKYKRILSVLLVLGWALANLWGKCWQSGYHEAEKNCRTGYATGQLYYLPHRLLEAFPDIDKPTNPSGPGIHRHYGCNKGFGVSEF